MPVQGEANGPERALDPHQPAGGRAQDHAREREQQQRGGDVAQQHVLDHVGREQVLLAQRVDRRGQRDHQRQHPAGEGQRLGPAGAAAARLAPRAAEAAHVDRDHDGQRRQHQRVGQPLQLGARRQHGHEIGAVHARDCGTGIPPVTRAAARWRHARPARPPRRRRRAAVLLGLRRRRGPGRAALPGLPRRACAGSAHDVVAAPGRARVVGGRLRGAGAGAGAGAQVPRRARPGRPAGRRHRRRRAARPARAGPGAGAGAHARGRAGGAAATTRRSGSPRRWRARTGLEVRRVPRARRGAAPGGPRAPAAAARERAAASVAGRAAAGACAAGRRRGHHRRHAGRLRGRALRRAGPGSVAAVTYARTPGR